MKLDLSKTGIKINKGCYYRESYRSRRDQPWSLRSCFQKKLQNVKQWYFLKCVVSCRLTISISLWHVRHFVSMHMIKDMRINFGAHNSNWIFSSFCFTNLCYQCECYLNLMLYTTLCWFVKCDTCNSYGNKFDLIWFDLIWKAALVQMTPNRRQVIIWTYDSLPTPIFVTWPQSDRWKYYEKVTFPATWS